MHNQTTIRATPGTVWVALLLALAPGASLAQDVGYPPARSPFRDLEYKQEVTLFGGWFA